LNVVPLKRILVADRDEIVLALTRHVLTREGYAVDTAADRMMLDDLLRLNTYGSILVDVNLVGTEWLQALPAGTSDRVIAIVSNGYDPLPVKTIIRKPLELDAIAQIVASSIEDRQLE
jgi:DNA-binding NtrC family response regulator